MMSASQIMVTDTACTAANRPVAFMANFNYFYLDTYLLD